MTFGFINNRLECQTSVIMFESREFKYIYLFYPFLSPDQLQTHFHKAKIKNLSAKRYR